MHKYFTKTLYCILFVTVFCSIVTNYSYAIGVDINSNAGIGINKGSFNLKGDLNVLGTLTASSLRTTVIGLTGTWTVSGSFVSGSSTVNLIGSDQSITGTNTFYNLTKTVTSAATMAFGSGTTQTIVNSLTMQGIANRLLSLESSNAGNQFFLNLQSGAVHTMSFLNVKDSNASGLALTADDSIDSGNNTNVTINETLIVEPTPTPIPTPGELAVLNVNPEESGRSLLSKAATVTAFDIEGNRLEGVAISAFASGPGAAVRPKEMKTGSDGTSLFIFKFGLISKDGKIAFTAEELSTTIIQTLTVRPAPTPKPTPGELFSLTVKPETFRRALLPRIAIVTALDRKRIPIKGVTITATTSGSIDIVRPRKKKTGRNGTAKFIFRFGVFAEDGKVTFTSDDLSVTITQAGKDDDQ
ncbi:MAG: hypothetical protein ACUZ8H_07200 [Candidatus Anammoxibacter sp.]